MKIDYTIRRFVSAFIRLLFPRQCAVCGCALYEGEELMCTACNMGMPRTNYHLCADNPVEKLFWGKFELGRATSYVYYGKGGDYNRIVHLLKYKDRPDLGNVMGRYMTAELLPTGFFEGIDVIVPVPLHPDKLKSRGYNQSECMANGVAELTCIPVDAGAVRRLRDSETQTHKSAYSRWLNVDGIFEVPFPEKYTGKHILLVDDVLTTSATTTACADAFEKVDGVKFSVLTWAVAH